jgi:NAD-dependent dihydropyrimidine dehydrogenase PreA subunit
MGRPVWQIKIITLFWPIRHFLARMVTWPVLGRWMKLTFKGDRAHYLPVQVEVKPPGSVVLPSQVVENLIRESSFRFILHQCLCRSLEPCRHFSPEIGCLFLGEGAREIEPALGREASVEEALAHHRKALDSGLIPMAGKLRWDSLWLGVKQADQLLTICHCCDCCCYFKLYRFLPPEAARGLQKMEGLEVQVQDACDGCGICVERCFIQAMQLRNGKAIVGENCRGCGRCALVCPQKAVKISLLATDSSGSRGVEFFKRP